MGYRIKTYQELESDYGPNWRTTVAWLDQMHFAVGMPLPSGVYYAPGVSVSLPDNTGLHWCFSSLCITDAPYPTGAGGYQAPPIVNVHTDNYALEQVLRELKDQSHRDSSSVAIMLDELVRAIKKPAPPEPPPTPKVSHEDLYKPLTMRLSQDA